MYTDIYKYKYDLHVHTSPVSKCGDFSPEEVVDKYIKAGFDGIVLTNHFSASALKEYKTKEELLDFYLSDYKKAYEYGREKGFSVFLGLEIRFPENDNDYLVYGIDEDDVKLAYDYIFTDYETFYKEFKNDRNVIIQAHPFRNSCVLQKLDIIDGIEVFNMHPGHNSKIAFAAKLVQENPQLLVTGGSDFHHEGHEAMCALCSKDALADSFAISETIKNRDFVLDVCGNKIII